MNESIVIIGAGFAGLGMAIALRAAGVHDFVLFEQSDGVGGTWRDNRYPGAACDIESHLYSFSFEPNPRWTRAYASQPEILAYLEHCADKYGVRPHIRLGTAVTGARFDAATGHWEVDTSDGRTTRARVLVSCVGGLSRPALPAIAGLESFTGARFHTARWPASASLAGARVAVIGTGASAIQVVPSIAPAVEQLFLFQRTAPWVIPKRDRDITDRERARFARFPSLQRLARAGQYVRHELLAVGFVAERRILRFGERLARRYLDRAIADPVLRARVTPDFRMGCKRVLLSNEYYPSLQRSNVELVTDGIERILPRAVRTRDGRERAVDTLVLATGFQAAESVMPFEVRGRDGRTLDAAWRDGPEAYLGTSVAGFPNLFFVVGPNTGLGHSSLVFMIESQITYILDALRTMRRRRAQILDVKPEPQARYNRELQARFPRTVWASGCASWYQTRNGRNTTLWPGFTFEFRRRTRRFDPAPYAIVRTQPRR